MPNIHPMGFRQDAVQVARNREPGVTLDKISAYFGIHPITLSNWLKRAGVEDGVRPGVRSAESAELRETNKRIRLLKKGVEVLKLSLAYVSQGSVLGKDFTRS